MCPDFFTHVQPPLHILVPVISGGVDTLSSALAARLQGRVGWLIKGKTAISKRLIWRIGNHRLQPIAVLSIGVSTHTHTHACTHLYTHMNTPLNTHTHTPIHTHEYTLKHTHTDTRTYRHTHTHHSALTTIDLYFIATINALDKLTELTLRPHRAPPVVHLTLRPNRAPPVVHLQQSPVQKCYRCRY